MSSLKSLAGSAVAAWITVGEIPTMFHFLGFLLSNLAGPGNSANADQGGTIIAELITNAIVPWWLDGLKFLAGAPLLALLFIGFVKWSGTEDA